MMIRRRLAEGDVDSEERATLDLRIKALMAHAKLRGWIVDRKQVDKRRVDISLRSAEDLQRLLSGRGCRTRWNWARGARSKRGFCG